MYGSEMMFVEASSAISPIFAAMGGTMLVALVGLASETKVLTGVSRAAKRTAKKSAKRTVQAAAGTTPAVAPAR